MASHSRFLADLSTQIEASAFLAVSDATAMLVDERQQFSGQALAIVTPSSVQQLASIMSLCHQHRISVVPQGGNTGYCGGATPDRSGSQLLVSLAKMNRVLEFDVDGQSLTVEAGMVLQDVQDTAMSKNLLFPLSMGSEGSCQIGGNLSTNAGGLAVLRYGTARDLVLGLEVVTPNGQVLSDLKTLRKNTTGYDLKHLFIGAEGTLGIIAAASLKLFPRPTTRFTAWLAVPGTNVLPQLLRALQSQLGDAVTSFEYISRNSLGFVLDNVERTTNPLGRSCSHYALVEVSGFEEPEAFAERCTGALVTAQEKGLVEDAVVAHSSHQASALWRLRESIPRAEKVLGGSIKHDVSVPVSRISEIISLGSKAVLAIEPGVRLSIYGHVGDGNVHFNVLPPESANPQTFKAEFGERISQAVHSVADSLDGSFSAEHGVGQLKTAELEKYSSTVRIELMRQIKQTLDPLGLMNPGKVIGR